MHAQSYGYNAFFPGDEIEFVRAGSLRAYASAIVSSAELVNPREILVTLEGQAPEGILNDDVIENVTWTPEVEIVNNYMARIPTRGVLVTTRKKVLIAENIFDRMTMSAILVADDAENWYESGRVEDLMIRNNIFVECGESGHPVISISPENTEVRSDHPVHQNIVIERNRFEMKDVAVMDAKSTRYLTFADNTITSSVELPQSRMITEVISLTACSDVTIKDNFFDHEGSNRAIRLHQMAPTAVSVQPAEQIMVIGR
jgi:polygalacturonase